MTTLNREALLKRVRALLAKTTENGCTEEEALAALTKARAMIDAYEISDDELALTKQEKAAFHSAGKMDRHGIRAGLSVQIAAFTDCRCYRNREGELIFVGLPSDADLAKWLLDSLQTFVQGELAAFLMSQTAFARGQRRRLINGFVIGACNRINERLRALMNERTAHLKTDNSRALVVVKKQLVQAALDEAGLRLRRTTSRRVSDHGAHAAGRAAGDRASFGKPVNAGGSSTRLLS